MIDDNVRKRHQELTQRYSTFGAKILQHADVLHRMQSERYIQPITIQLAPVEGCFTGDTMVPLLNGTRRSLKDLAENENDPFWVYSFDTQRMMIVPGRALRSRLTRKNVQTLNITLDNNEVVKCTLDHEFLLRDGTYKRADELVVGQSLMPLYRRSSTAADDPQTVGYDMVLEPETNEWIFTHRRVTDEVQIQSIAWIDENVSISNERRADQTVRHHIDINKLNNSPENLAWMSVGDHRKLHANRTKWLTSIGKNGFQLYTKTKKHRERSSQYMKEVMWPAIKRGEIDRSWSIEAKQNVSNLMKQRNKELSKKNEHPFQKAVLNGTSHVFDCEFRKKNSEIQKELVKAGKHNTQTPEFKKKVSEAQLKKRQDGTHLFNSDEHRSRSSERMKNIHKYHRYLDENQLSKNDLSFQDWKSLANIAPGTNHKIIAIELGEISDVYCLEVENYANFALEAGIFVHNCDSTCPFCSVALRPLKERMTWEQIEKTLTSFRYLGAKSLEITGGGNPMLYKDKATGKNINDIVKLGYELGYDVGIITNSEKLKRLDPSVYDMLSWVRISLIKLDEGVEPEEYDFNGFPYEKLGFSYIIYSECAAEPVRGKYYEGTSEKTIEKIAKLVDLHEGKIKFVRFAGDCLIRGNNMLVRKNFQDVVNANDKYKKFFIKDIDEMDVPYDAGCYVGLIRPYIAPHPQGGGDYYVYICTSHVLNNRTYDLDYALCKVEDILPTWNELNRKFKETGVPYEVKGNCGKNWCDTCPHCFYAPTNQVLHTVASELPDKNFA